MIADKLGLGKEIGALILILVVRVICADWQVAFLYVQSEIRKVLY